MVYIGNDWDNVLEGEFEKDYYKKLEEFLEAEYREHTVYPPKENLFNALKFSSYEDTKVVILGQDPYHEPNQAHGLCFSVNKGVKAVSYTHLDVYKRQMYIRQELRIF